MCKILTLQVWEFNSINDEMWCKISMLKFIVIKRSDATSYIDIKKQVKKIKCAIIGIKRVWTSYPM